MLQINLVSKLDLGVKDENNARDIFIDMNAWYTDYPNGTFSIWHKRNGDQTKYAASGVTFDRETGILKWTPDAYDTYYVGRGLAEIRLTENSVIKKTKDILTDVEKSLVLPSGSTLTSGWQAYLNQIESDKNTVMQAVGQIGDNVEKSEAWATGKKDGQDVDPSDETYHNNSKYYAAQAAGSAEDASGYASDADVAADAAEDAQLAAEAARDKYPQIDELTEKWKLWNPSTSQYVVTDHPSRGPQGVPGPGVPAGGTTGQILTKKSNADQDTEWANAPDPTGKADKVSGATSGNFAGLDANGNLTDSGHKHSDYLTSHQDITGKADKVSSATSGNFAGLDGNGNLTDSGKKHADYVVKDQGVGNAGKALGIGNDGLVTPVPFSGTDFTGATASTAGVHGYVPAPAAGDQGKFLCGDGTWAAAPGAKPVTVDLDQVTNVSGSYTHTTANQYATAGMKPIGIWTSDPDVFREAITITVTDGYITLTCDDVVGTSDVSITMMKQIDPNEGDPPAVTSTEFDILNNRIGTLSSLTTTVKTSAVAAINELDGELGDPTSASGVTGNDAFSKIGTLNSNFSPTTFSPVTVPHGSVESGGYIKIGKLVILQVRIRTTEATVEFITGLPKPLNALSNPSAGVVRVTENISMNSSGTVVSGSSLSAGVYQFAVIYVCE